MNVEVNLFASLKRYKPNGTGSGFWNVECTEGTTALDLLNRFGIPAKDVKLIFINGLYKDNKVILQEGDRVGIFPLVGGG